MDGNLRTLSLGSWMQLPGMPFEKWLEVHHAGLVFYWLFINDKLIFPEFLLLLSISFSFAYS